MHIEILYSISLISFYLIYISEKDRQFSLNYLLFKFWSFIQIHENYRNRYDACVTKIISRSRNNAGMVQIKALCNIDMVQAHHKQDISSNPQRKTFTPQKKNSNPSRKKSKPPRNVLFRLSQAFILSLLWRCLLLLIKWAIFEMFCLLQAMVMSYIGIKSFPTPLATGQAPNHLAENLQICPWP